eukprot:scaffold437_cov111-Cylindrotheca_fusiformis.AAC.12
MHIPYIQIAELQGKIKETLSSKNDGTIASAAEKVGSAMIRAPPSTKTRRVLKGHFGKITALHWGGDSRRLVSASQDGNLLLWNAVTANKLRSFTLKSSYVMSVGIEQKKGNMIACGGLDNLCTIYKLSQGSTNSNTSEPSAAAHEMASHDGFVSCCRFLSEQQILTSSGDSSCIQWDIPTGRVLNTFKEHEETAMFLSLKPGDNNVFISCSVDKTAKVWDARTPSKSTMTFTGHLGDVNGVDFMPCDSNAFATCGNDGTARVWDLRSYQEVARFGTPVQPDPFDPSPGLTSVGFSKSGRLLFASHCDSSVLAFDVLTAGKTDAPAFTLQNAHDNYVSCLQVSPDGSALCTGSWDYNLKVGSRNWCSKS